MRETLIVWLPANARDEKRQSRSSMVYFMRFAALAKGVSLPYYDPTYPDASILTTSKCHDEPPLFEL